MKNLLRALPVLAACTVALAVAGCAAPQAGDYGWGYGSSAYGEAPPVILPGAPGYYHPYGGVFGGGFGWPTDHPYYRRRVFIHRRFFPEERFEARHGFAGTHPFFGRGFVHRGVHVFHPAGHPFRVMGGHRAVRSGGPARIHALPGRRMGFHRAGGGGRRRR